ncbi:MAG: hypothetical protein EOO94_04385 [Pedobacter sp.]|nr:MAG: hypothetical protein EOO94_04385 [Pedobacter sp.]
MKKQFLMITSLMVMGVATFAGNNKPVAGRNNPVAIGNSPVSTASNPVLTGNSSRSWSLDEKFNSIIAKGNIELVLVSNNSNKVDIEGLEKYVNELHLKVEHGVLTITGRKSFSRVRTVVYVPVHELDKVTLKANANVSSKGRIDSKNLQIRIEGTSTVNVKSSGDVIIDSDDLHEFNYQKSEKSIVRIEKA